MPKILVNPYLPSGSVTKALLSEDAPEEIKNSFRLRGIELILVKPLESLPSPLARHADMQLVNVCEGVFVYAPGVAEATLAQLKLSGFDLVKGSVKPGNIYPFDVAYNCAVVGGYAFLNPKCSDTVLLDTLKMCGITVLPVKQGYAKCSICVLSNEAIITADRTIHNKACENGMDSLLIPPQKNIVLAGYKYGFIGGSSGMLSGHELALLGSLETLESRESISNFLKKHGITPISLTNENLVDLGGVIPLCSV